MVSIKIGDIVKALDFNGVDDCYMVGKVVGIHGDEAFRAQLIKRVWRGAEDRKFKTDFFVAPMQGEHMFDTPASPRVTVIA
jgi:hypothetical protein